MLGKITNKPKGGLSERQRRIFDFLNSQKAGVLASVDPNGEPHATVIYHTIDKKDFGISFLTKTGTRKHDNLIRNSHVVLVVFDQKKQTVAQVVGTASEVTDPDEINSVAAAVCAASLQTSENGIIPIAKLEAGEYTVFRVEPSQIRIAYYAGPESGDYKDIFESVESFDLQLKD